MTCGNPASPTDLARVGRELLDGRRFRIERFCSHARLLEGRLLQPDVFDVVGRRTKIFDFEFMLLVEAQLDGVVVQAFSIALAVHGQLDRGKTVVLGGTSPLLQACSHQQHMRCLA